MSLPELTNWDATKANLRAAARVGAAVKAAVLEPMPNALRQALLPTPLGATTGRMGAVGQFWLDYTRGQLNYAGDSGGFGVMLSAYSQRSLAEHIVTELSGQGHEITPELDEMSEEPLELDLSQAMLYAAVQWRMFTALARLKARLFGPQTPLVLWPHGFDLSTLWFMGPDMNEARDPHLNFGFSPGTPDVGQPYVYFYASPIVPGLEDNLPNSVQWHTEWGTPGGIIPYEVLRADDNSEELIVEAFSAIYEAVRRG